MSSVDSVRLCMPMSSLFQGQEQCKYSQWAQFVWEYTVCSMRMCQVFVVQIADEEIILP